MLTSFFIQELLDITHALSKEILKIYESNHINTDYKKDASPVTSADLLSHKTLESFLSKKGYPIISEESKRINKYDSEFVWIIDPLDGTADFIKKTGEFSIMIGLLKDNKPYFGIVHQPTTGKTFVAQKNKGSFLIVGGRKKVLRVSKESKIESMTIGISRNHWTKKDKASIRKLNIKKVKYLGSIGLKIGLIVEGESDILINTSSKTFEWDTCAPQIVLHEAGGKMTDLFGNSLTYNKKNPANEEGIVATNGRVHEEIISLMNRG